MLRYVMSLKKTWRKHSVSASQKRRKVSASQHTNVTSQTKMKSNGFETMFWNNTAGIQSIFCLTMLVLAPASVLLMATELNGSAPLTFAGTAFTTVPAPSFLISLLPTKHI